MFSACVTLTKGLRSSRIDMTNSFESCPCDPPWPPAFTPGGSGGRVMSGKFFIAPRYSVPSIQPFSPNNRPVSPPLLNVLRHFSIRDIPPSAVSNSATSSVFKLSYALTPGKKSELPDSKPTQETEV